MITYRQLEAFFFSVRLGSFRAAADRLCTTQSAVSKRIADLESQLGTAVLTRSAHGIRLTRSGRELLPRAEAARALWADIEKHVADDSAVRGTLRLGVTEFVALQWLSRLIPALRARHPELAIEPSVNPGLALLDDLKATRIDVAILPGRHWGSDYQSVPIASVQQCWLAAPSLKVPRRVLQPADFASYTLIAEARTASKRRFYDAWCEANGYVFAGEMVAGSAAVVRELAAAGFGICLLSRDSAASAIEAGTLQVVRSQPALPPTDYCAVYASENATRLVEAVAQAVAEEAGALGKAKARPREK